MQIEFRQFIRYFLLLLTLLPIVLINSCQKGDPVGLRDVVEGSNNLITGEFVDVVTETIGASGGTIKINNSADPMNGFEISVPPNSFTEAHTFEITRAEIKSHNLGQYFDPISPLIRINNGGGYADDLMEVKVPVKVPEGYFAMGFFYDEKTGTLEGLPLLALDSTSVTIGTRHFTTSNLSGGSSMSLLKGNALPSFSDLVISVIDLSVLQGEDVIETGYKLREDNWEFVNRGPYIEPKGICAGMSLTSMWYYYERSLPKIADPLYGLFDQVDDFSPDNRRGIRFAATIQSDYQGGLLKKIFNEIRSNPDYDYLSWHAFALSMLTTGEPQYVSILSDAGGHALAAYRISLSAGTLSVADPNFPNDDRTIEYANKHFLPYSSKQNVDEPDPEAYNHIGYCSKTSIIDWAKIGERWKEFENNTIGNDRFPEYKIMVIGKAGISELGDKLTTDSDSLIVETRCPGSEIRFENTDNAVDHEIYDETGKLLASTISDRNPYYRIPIMGTALKLKPGLNKLGYVIYGNKENAKYKDGSLKPLWIDFRWVEVTYQTLEIQSAQQDGAPILKPGEPNKEYKFVARSYGSAPAKAKYIWNFGDGTQEVTVANDSTIEHTFLVAGNYVMTLSLYNNATNALVGTAQASALIGGNLLGLLQKCIMINARFISSVNYSDGNTSDADLDFINSKEKYVNSAAITWSGNNFTVKCNAKRPTTDPAKFFLYDLSITGRVSPDGMIVTSLIATEDKKLDVDPRIGYHWKAEMKNVPFYTNMSAGSDIIQLMYDSNYFTTVEQVQQLVSKVEIVESTYGSGNTVVTTSYVSTNWSSSSRVYVWFFSFFM